MNHKHLKALQLLVQNTGDLWYRSLLPVTVTGVSLTELNDALQNETGCTTTGEILRSLVPKTLGGIPLAITENTIHFNKHVVDKKEFLLLADALRFNIQRKKPFHANFKMQGGMIYNQVSNNVSFLGCTIDADTFVTDLEALGL